MKTTRYPGIRTALCMAFLALAAGCAEKPAAIHSEASATQASAPQAPKPAAVEDVLMRMAGFLAKTPQFSVNVQDSYEVLQESGQKIEFSENRRLTVSRPNGLRIEVEHSDGEKHLVLYDGKQITAFSPTQNVYAQVSKPGGIDEAVTYFLKDLHMRLPLAAMLLSRLPEELKNRTESLAYVESTVVDGMPSHHVAGRTETVDYQIWIADGAKPLPLRVVLTYKNAEGQPAFRAQFSDWNLEPSVRDSLFAFNPPAGSKKIAFAAESPQIAFEGAANPEQTGGQK